ncbi:hypothetical protein CVT24_010742 [Panaeolus cyanescens]|uniref:PBP domain-containing protein n=1 Tax=Panaeolus cyanescens TaxID=181874 RepID=A0A409YNL9_9AGAR|nr:hypothetical protein CVT24_010742 [Panaeolus cyanescens]
MKGFRIAFIPTFDITPSPSMLFFGIFARFFEKKKRSTSKSKSSHENPKRTKSAKAVLFLNEKSSESTILTDQPHGTAFDGSKSSLPGPTPPGQGQSRPFTVYDGGFGEEAKIRGVCLRIANGGAGQTGLIKAWADAFIQDMVSKGAKPFQVAWYLGDTTESLAMLSEGVVDVAVTYNPAAEQQVVDAGLAVDRVYGFRDHFALVGPCSNPARINEGEKVESIFSKIVACGNADVARPPDPSERPPTRFLSRFDKSATNIKESELFARIGQVPWAFDYSKWYHQYPRFPREALIAASALSEYTLTDKGSWLSAPESVKASMKVYKIGSDNADDPLLNPAHVLLGKQASRANEDTCKAFMTWVVADNGGQKVIDHFPPGKETLYSRAPKSQ